MLSGRDLDRLRRALRMSDAGVVVDRTVKGLGALRISVCDATFPWLVARIIRVETFTRCAYTTQYFASVEEMMEYV